MTHRPAGPPPIVPTTRVTLDRAIVLLGARTRGDLRAGKVAELVGLLGRYPDPVLAREWKTLLKSLRDDEIFDRAG